MRPGPSRLERPESAEGATLLLYRTFGAPVFLPIVAPGLTAGAKFSRPFGAFKCILLSFATELTDSNPNGINHQDTKTLTT